MPMTLTVAWAEGTPPRAFYSLESLTLLSWILTIWHPLLRMLNPGGAAVARQWRSQALD